MRTEPLVDMRCMTRTLVPLGFQLAIQVEMEVRACVLDGERETGGRVRGKMCKLEWTHHERMQRQPHAQDLTVGGLCMGLGMETNSHLFGLIQETVVAFEIVTARGELLRVTKHSDPELFATLPWSHGTLGFLVAVELRIIPIKK